jgi:hypothetical protein
MEFFWRNQPSFKIPFPIGFEQFSADVGAGVATERANLFAHPIMAEVNEHISDIEQKSANHVISS